MKKIHQRMTNYQIPALNVRQNYIVKIFLQVSCEYDISGELLYLFSIFRSDVSGGCRIADQCSAAPCYHNFTTFTKPIQLLKKRICLGILCFNTVNQWEIITQSSCREEMEKWIQKKCHGSRLQSILCHHM